MRIVLATPLYPPEIAEPAPYAKELARRLSETYEVVVVAYSHLPEELSNVRVSATDKRQPLSMRLIACTRALIRETSSADVLYAINGASVELPFIIASFFIRARRIFCIADTRAHASQNFLSRVLERLARVRAHIVIEKLPPPRPEILPFAPRPVEAIAAYEAAWKQHLQTLDSLFNHAH